MKPATFNMQPTACNVQPPAHLDTPEFYAAWETWLAHRRAQRGGKAMSPRRQRAEMARVASWPLEDGIAGLETSARMGFREIYPAGVGIPEKEARHLRRLAVHKIQVACRKITDPAILRELTTLLIGETKDVSAGEDDI